jgi:signal transduction histidine kinase
VRLRVTAKFVLLLCVAVLLAAAAYAWLRASQDENLRILVSESKRDRTTTFDKLMTLKGHSIEALAFDYTYWDEFVSFIAGENPRFATDQLDTCLPTYEADWLSVHRPDGSLVYSIARDEDEIEHLDASPLPADVVRTALAGSRRLCHFFLRLDDGLVEVRGATVHPSEDEERETEPRGLFFVGRRWNDGFLAEVRRLTDADVRVVDSRTAEPPEPGDAETLAFSRLLPGLVHPTERADVRIRLPFLGEARRAADAQARQQVISFAGLGLLLTLAVTVWVVLPLRHVTQALDTQSEEPLRRISSTGDEFERIAALIRASFEQQRRLEVEVGERKAAEARALDALKVRSEFTSMVSHELRTPLSVISESVALVYEGIAGPVSDEQKDFLDTARRNTERLTRLINDVLDYQKLQAGRMEYRFVEVDANEVVRECARGFSMVANARGLALAVDTHPDLPRVRGDHDKLVQVLTNLFNNAVRFTERGTITLRTAPEPGGGVRVSVRDEGIGIKEADLEKLFKSFSQVSTGLSRKSGGTGLGLAISKEIVEAHGGRVGVESTWGKGSTFFFVLPAPAT